MRTIRAWTTLSWLPIIMGCGVQLDSLLLMPSQTFRIKPSDLNYSYEEVVLPSKDGSTINRRHLSRDKEHSFIQLRLPRRVSASKERLPQSPLRPRRTATGWYAKQ